MFRGELWKAIEDEELPPDTKVYVSSVDGIVLHVSSHPPPAAKEPPLRSRLTFFLRRKAA